LKSAYLIAIVLVLLSQAGVFANGGLVGARIDKHPWHAPPSEAELRRVYEISGMVLSSTPLDTHRQFKGPSTVSVVKCHFDDFGFLSELRLDQDSIWSDQDFYTLWAVASFPPVKPFSRGILEPTMIICNGPGPARDTSAAESSIREAVANALSQENYNKRIRFPIIAGAFIEVFPDIHLSDICDKENLVSISYESLQQSRNGGWTKYSATKMLESKNTIADLLDEWPAFFKRNLNPSRAELLTFAAHLKEKYKVLFSQ
jgi:hypothetical protein